MGACVLEKSGPMVYGVTKKQTNPNHLLLEHIRHSSLKYILRYYNKTQNQKPSSPYVHSLFPFIPLFRSALKHTQT